MSARVRWAAAAALVLAALPFPAAAQSWSGWTAYWENDSFVFGLAGSDDAFTNGVRLAVGRNPNAAADARLDWLQSWLGRHSIFRPGRDTDPNTSLVLGQNFFTPLEITTYLVDPTDRPYAGFTYLGLRAEVTERAAQEPDPEADTPGATRDKAFQSQRQHSAEVDVGVIGPAAGAESVQSAVHAVLRLHRVPKGWYTQIGNSPGLSGYYMVRQKLGWPFLDVVPHVGAMLGTTQIYPFAGATVRLGWNMTGFPALVGRNTAVSAQTRPDWEVGVIAGGEGRYFLRNSFVQGTLFGSGEGVELIRPVGDYRLGFFWRLLDWRLTYTMLRRSPEVAEQGPSERLYDNYGSLSFAYEPGLESSASRFLDAVIHGGLGTLLDDFILEAGIGPDLLDERAADVDQTNGMHIAVGRALPGFLSDFDVLYEVVGSGREIVPPTLLANHADRFLVNTLATLRYRPAGGRLGPGQYHLRAGVGRGTTKYEITPGVTGDREGPCPPGTAFGDDDDHRYCSSTDDGTGYMLGLAYTLDWGSDIGFNSDLSWNHLDVEGDQRFLALTFGFRWAPR